MGWGTNVIQIPGSRRLAKSVQNAQNSDDGTHLISGQQPRMSTANESIKRVEGFRTLPGNDGNKSPLIPLETCRLTHVVLVAPRQRKGLRGLHLGCAFNLF